MKIWAVLQREFLDNLRNLKLPFLLVFILGGVIMALYTEAGPTANSTSILDPFFELFAVLCPLMGIFAAMDAIVGEKERGTLEIVLSKPIPRSSLLYGKFFTYVLMVVPLLVVELILAYFWAQISGISTYRWNMPMPPFSQWMSMVAILSLVAVYYIALTMLISMLAWSTATTALAGIICMSPAHPVGGEILRIIGSMVGIDTFPAVPWLIRPALSIFGHYQKFALTSYADFWLCCASLLAITIFLLFIGRLIFARQNVAYRY